MSLRNKELITRVRPVKSIRERMGHGGGGGHGGHGGGGRGGGIHGGGMSRGGWAYGYSGNYGGGYYPYYYDDYPYYPYYDNDYAFYDDYTVPTDWIGRKLIRIRDPTNCAECIYERNLPLSYIIITPQETIRNYPSGSTLLFLDNRSIIQNVRYVA